MLDKSGHGHKFRKNKFPKLLYFANNIGKKTAIFSNVYSVESIGNLGGFFGKL